MKARIITSIILTLTLCFNLKTSGQIAPLQPDNGFINSKKRSILLVMDVSGSMDGSKLGLAKIAAINAIEKHQNYDTEFAVLTFEGDCDTPISQECSFTNDINKLKKFINSLEAGGGTPLAPAYEYACSYMAGYSRSNSEETIVLIGDGDNHCGDLDATLSQLKQKGILFITKTIGLDIEPASPAERELKMIASRTLGNYTPARNAEDLYFVLEQTMIETLLCDIKIIYQPVKRLNYNAYSQRNISLKVDNSIWLLDSVKYYSDEETIRLFTDLGLRYELKDFPGTFIFRNGNLSFYDYRSRSWQDGSYSVFENNLEIKAKIQSEEEKEFPFKVKILDDNKMELALKKYDGEKFSCAPVLGEDDSSVIVYFSRIEI